MWIRSQGMSLRKYDGIFINCLNVKEVCGDAKFQEEDNHSYFVLGKYKTEERALEVLEEIQNKIAEVELNKIMPDRFISVGDFIYEMPEE
jgi:hypothetical protein